MPPSAAHPTRYLVIALLACSGLAHAAYKCTGPDGKVSFQDAPCSGGTAQKLNVQAAPISGPDAAAAAARNRAETAAVNARGELEAAVSRGEPAIGMTREQLDRAMGQPDTINASNYDGQLHDQLIYHRGERTLYVYTRNGIVRSIQNTAGVGSSRPKARCLTEHEIRDIETSASSRFLSDEQRRRYADQIREARECSRS